MERQSGFLVIDRCKKVASRYREQYFVYIDGEEYYFKPTKYCYNELVTYHILKYLGIDACYVDLAVLNGKKGIISKSLRREGAKLVPGNEILRDYLSSSTDVIGDMGFDTYYLRNLRMYYSNNLSSCSRTINTLEIIWQALEDRYKDKINISEVMDAFVMMHLFDIIVNNTDRHEWNWMIEESSESIRLAPLFDFDFCLRKDYGKFKMGVNFEDLNSGGCILNGARDSLLNFLEVSSYDYLYLFISMFDKVVNNFDKIINEAEIQIGRKIPVASKIIMNKSLSKVSKQINDVLSSDKIGKYVARIR